MKFLHFADLHLGRSLHQHSLYEDQQFLTQQICKLAQSDTWAGILFAGDIYDRSLPGREAVNLLDELLANLHNTVPGLPIFLIPGNHDSPTRLAYGQGIFSKLGIHIVSEAEKAFEPIIIEQNDKKCAVFLLPFLSPGSLSRKNEEGLLEPLRAQSELHLEASARLEKARKKAEKAGAEYSILLAHLFAGGGTSSQSERIFLGTAELVNMGLYKGFSYVALGHLHRRQRAGENGWYAGSPLAWAFDEAGKEKGGLSVELCAEGNRIEPIDISPLHPLSKLKGSMDDFLIDGKGSECQNHYVEIELDGSELVENPLALLRNTFPLLLSVRQEQALKVFDMEQDRHLRQEAGQLTEDLNRAFDLFLQTQYGEEHQREEEQILFAEYAQRASEGEEE